MRRFVLYIMDVEYCISYMKAKSTQMNKISGVYSNTCCIVDQDNKPEISSLTRLEKRILMLHQKEIKSDYKNVNIFVKPIVSTFKYPSSCLVK